MSLPISKTTSDIPNWVIKSVLPNSRTKKEIDSAIVVNDSGDLTNVKSKIEESVKTGSDICIKGELNEQQKNELKEYAEICNVDPKKIIEVNDSSILLEKQEEKVKSIDKDPFGVLDSFASSDNFIRNKNWDKIKESQKISNKGITEGSVSRIDGKETYEHQRNEKIKSSENSIFKPNNISSLANSKSKDNSQIIKESNEKRKNKISFDSSKWENEVKSKYSGIISNKGIKLTEASPQQSHSKLGMSQPSFFDSDDRIKNVPDKTVGETIKTEMINISLRFKEKKLKTIVGIL